MEQERRCCSPKVCLIQILVYLVLIVNMAKYVYLELPEIENKLAMKHIDKQEVKIYLYCIVAAKVVETFFSGYFYYFSLSTAIKMIKSDSNIISEIANIIRLLRN